MEASDGVIRGNVDSLVRLIHALETAGIEILNDNVPSAGGGRGVRLRIAPRRSGFWCIQGFSIVWGFIAARLLSGSRSQRRHFP
jgi:hypothetical protein